MTVEEFEEQIKHLDQTEVLAASISSLNNLLVEKNLIKAEELQKHFLDWMRSHGRSTEHLNQSNDSAS